MPSQSPARCCCSARSSLPWCWYSDERCVVPRSSRRFSSCYLAEGARQVVSLDALFFISRPEVFRHSEVFSRRLISNCRLMVNRRRLIGLGAVPPAFPPANLPNFKSSHSSGFGLISRNLILRKPTGRAQRCLQSLAMSLISVTTRDVTNHNGGFPSIFGRSTRLIFVGSPGSVAYPYRIHDRILVY